MDIGGKALGMSEIAPILRSIGLWIRNQKDLK